MAMFSAGISPTTESPATQPTVTYTGTDGVSYTKTVYFYKMGDLKIVKLALDKVSDADSIDYLVNSIPSGYEPTSGMSYFTGISGGKAYRSGIITSTRIRLYGTTDTSGGMYATCVYV